MDVVYTIWLRNMKRYFRSKSRMLGSLGMPLFFLLVPLLFPLPGMLRDRSYTFAWSSFLSLLYFIHGIGEFYSEPEERIYAGLEILFSLLWFGGAIFYVRKYKQIHANAHGSAGHREPGK